MHLTPHFSDAAPALDARRIAGNSLALAVHAFALAVLMLPSTWSPPPRPLPDETVMLLEPVRPVSPRPMPAPPSTPVATPAPKPVATPTPLTVPAADSLTEALAAADSAPDTGETPATGAISSGRPALAALACHVCPAPPYPRAALRAGKTGRVLLRLLVDEQGWPLQVTVDASSGHRDLDRAAAEHVKAMWRLHPARHQGRAVSAQALVPIEFNLP